MQIMKTPNSVSMMLVAIHAVVSTGALAQSPVCAQRSRVVGQLAEQYQEAPVGIGVTSGGGIVEVLSSSDGETWTIIVSTPDGLSCLIASGESWRPIEFEAALSDSSI